MIGSRFWMGRGRRRVVPSCTRAGVVGDPLAVKQPPQEHDASSSRSSRSPNPLPKSIP